MSDNERKNRARRPDENEDGEKRVEDITRVVLRPLASPLPLAFFAFGVDSLLLSGQQLGLIPLDETRMVAIVMGLFVFLLQALAAVFAFLARETLGAPAISMISTSWLATSVTTYTLPPGTPRRRWASSGWPSPPYCSSSATWASRARGFWQA
jgi:succinate-acetate transporter protein